MMINLVNYTTKLGQQYTLFRFATNAMESFKSSPPSFREFLQKEKERLSHATQSREEFKNGGPDTADMLQSLCTFLEDKLDFDSEKQLDTLLLRLRQQSVIHFHAAFEALLRDILRELLYKHQENLKADRDIKLGKLISTPKESIIREEIERQIALFDRWSVEDKAKYFQDKFGISWSTYWTHAFKSLNQFRQEILHDDIDRVVIDDDVELALEVTSILGWGICMQGWLLDPELFYVGQVDKRRIEEDCKLFRK